MLPSYAVVVVVVVVVAVLVIVRSCSRYCWFIVCMERMSECVSFD